MLRSIQAFLSAQTRAQLTVFVFVQVALCGALDHLTGYEFSFSIFYLIPISIASWFLGNRLGLVLCLASALTWFTVDYMSGNIYSNSAVPFWNTGVRLGFFLLVNLLLVRLHTALDLQAVLAQIDGLTGLMNPRAFRQNCMSQFALAQRHQQQLTLGYLDLDGFKGINDGLGHSVGDQVLIAVADTMRKRLRSSDIGARLGGDEFSLLLPQTNLEGARVFFSGLHEGLTELAVDNNWPIGFSFGVAVFDSPEESPEEAIRRADGLMYKVKKSGKNSILFAEFGGGETVFAT